MSCKYTGDRGQAPGYLKLTAGPHLALSCPVAPGQSIVGGKGGIENYRKDTILATLSVAETSPGLSACPLVIQGKARAIFKGRGQGKGSVF